MKNSKAFTVFLLIVATILVGYTGIKYRESKNSELTIDNKVQEVIIKKGGTALLKSLTTIQLQKAKTELALQEKSLAELSQKDELINKRYKSFMDLIEMNKKALAVNID
jgi:hypothetical protein